MAAVCGKYLGSIDLPIPIEEAPRELSKIEIFNQLAAKTCRVEWEWKGIPLSTTGCFIKRLGQERVQILTCFHDESWKTAQISMIYKVRADGKELFSTKIECTLDPEVVFRNAKRVDLCLLNFSKKITPSHFFETTNNSSYLSLGETVYFSGFPLSKEHPLIHMGYISSKEKKETISQFTIDGTVVAGHSGGPVVMVNNGNLELIGIISSQMVSMTQSLLKASKAQIDPIAAFNDCAGSYGDSDIRTVLQDLMSNFLKNISTGIGNVNATTNLPYLFEEETISTEEPSDQMVNELPTAITKKGSYQILDDRTRRMKAVEFSITARELRTPGKGPRAIVVSIDGVPNSKYTYRLANPHGGNYNKHVEKVYDAAASELAQQYALSNGRQMPQHAQFEEKKVIYELTLEK